MTDVIITTFNNRGFPRQSQKNLNIGDYAVRNHAHPDYLMEQERWYPEQLGGFKKIFNTQSGYRTYTPLSVPGNGGSITARDPLKFQHLAHFSYLASYPVLGVCGSRRFSGEVCKVHGTSNTATCFSAHLPPSAWSDRFKDGSYRKRHAQRQWTDGMERMRGFAERQIKGGRDYVLIGIDANAGHDRVRDAWGEAVAGKKVQIWTSPYHYRIDHIIAIGDVTYLSDDNASIKVPSDHRPFSVKLRLH